jgi:hypothetical protein
LQQVSLLGGRLSSLLKDPACKAWIDVIAWSEDGDIDYVLAPFDLSSLASLGIPVWFSFADYPDDEKE